MLRWLLVHWYVWWSVGAVLTFAIALSLMSVVYNIFVVAAWCIFAWPLYLVIAIVSAMDNP